MIEERSIYQNVDTLNTFPTKYVHGVSGFMGNQNPKNLGKQNPIFFIYSESQIF